MPPKCVLKDTLTLAEKELLDIAVCLYCVVKYNKEHKGEVSEAWLMQGIEEELVCVVPSYMTRITHWEGQDSVDKIFNDEHNTPRVVTTTRIHFIFLTFIYHVYYYSWSHDRRVFISHMTHYESFLGLYFPHDSSQLILVRR
jgi:hypothetical protein